LQTWTPPLLPTKIVGRGKRELLITWSDGPESVLTVGMLRQNCPCAGCDDLRKHADPLRVLPASVKPVKLDQLVADQIELVGNYAIQIRFSDGHDTGIFTFDHLRRLAAQSAPPAGSG
jgi:DUF971 family protein